MQVLVLHGSGRREGNTARVTALFLEALRQEADRAGVTLDIAELRLIDMGLQPCLGCRACFDSGEAACPRRDGLLTIHQAIQSCDGLLITTPVYVNDVSGLVKTWIDRTAFVCHRPAYAGRSAYLLCTTGSSPGGHTLQSLRVPLMTWGVHIVGGLCLRAGALSSRATLESAYGQRLGLAARRFWQALQTRAALRPTLAELTTFRAQQEIWRREAHDTCDYAYWHEQGWLHADVSYYVAHRTTWPVVWLARLAGALIARFMV